jgi:serine/threonine-protein kinase RsbW
MKTISKEIKSVRRNINEIDELFLKINEDFQLPAEEYDKLMIAVTEVVNNAIIHGNKQDEKKNVEINVEYDDKMMKIKICDEGNGFDYDETPDPRLKENLLKSSGRGMFIVKSLIEDVEYRHTEKGSEIIITIKKK